MFLYTNSQKIPIFNILTWATLNFLFRFLNKLATLFLLLKSKFTNLKDLIYNLKKQTHETQSWS